ncbi:Transposable element P transposase [Oopsacas minuta]|uniref:Transposable element P transposase n=1 Tax=Oopsacas minuta TaxID=111878 RepID=A0AAV7JSN2_9METZ|nr:Transposable element P transposase [Oopsacas minuta]
MIYSCTTPTPCAKSSAAQILPILHEVIKDVESCNLQFQVICTDNYPLNVNLFKLLSPTSNLETCVPRPLHTCRPLYLIFDFAHIIKRVRNNWLNQIDSNHTFSCPSFISCEYTLNVPFQDLRSLFKLEQNSVAKTAHRLTAKSCWPSSLERQNVNLALRIFDDSTSAALTVHASKYGQVSETAQFIALFVSTLGESSISLKDFLKSFSISEESSDDNIVDLDPYNRVFNEEETPIILDTSLIQSLAFIAGYCIHSIFKSAFYSKRGITHSSGVRDTEEVSSICFHCLSSLVEEDTLE